MERKAIAAFLVGCAPEEFMAYADKGEEGCAVIGPDGKKYVFGADVLYAAEPKAKAAAEPVKHAEPAAKPKPAAKSTTRRQTTRRKTTTKKANGK